MWITQPDINLYLSIYLLLSWNTVIIPCDSYFHQNNAVSFSGCQHLLRNSCPGSRFFPSGANVTLSISPLPTSIANYLSVCMCVGSCACRRTCGLGVTSIKTKTTRWSNFIFSHSCVNTMVRLEHAAATSHCNYAIIEITTGLYLLLTHTHTHSDHIYVFLHVLL